MPEIKICGLVSADDAALVSGAGADYAGFVFHAPSKRNVSIDQAREIMAALDASVKKVAVVVSPQAARAREILSLPFDVLQVHGKLDAQVLSEAGAAGVTVWQAVNIDGLESLKAAQPVRGGGPGDGVSGGGSEDGGQAVSGAPGGAAGAGEITGILIDAKEYGSGKTFDWAAASQISRAAKRLCGAISEKSGAQVKFILAGGLHPGNVAEGIRLFEPDVVDVSSGVEYDGGRGKDPRKVEAFLKAVRR